MTGKIHASRKVVLGEEQVGRALRRLKDGMSFAEVGESFGLTASGLRAVLSRQAPDQLEEVIGAKRLHKKGRA